MREQAWDDARSAGLNTLTPASRELGRGQHSRSAAGVAGVCVGTTVEIEAEFLAD